MEINKGNPNCSKFGPIILFIWINVFCLFSSPIYGEEVQIHSTIVVTDYVVDGVKFPRQKINIKFKNLEDFPIFCSKIVLYVDYYDGDPRTALKAGDAPLFFKNVQIAAGAFTPLRDSSQEIRDYVQDLIPHYQIGNIQLDKSATKCRQSQNENNSLQKYRLATMQGGHVKMWNTNSEGPIYSLPTHGRNGEIELQELYDMAYSPDGSLFAFGGSQETLIWNVKEEKVTLTLEGGLGLSFCPNKNQLAMGDYDTVKIWDLEVNKVVRTFTNSGMAYTVLYSPNGKYLATTGGFGNKIVKIWDLETEKLIHSLEGPSGDALSITFSPDSKYLAIAADNSDSITVWDLKTGYINGTMRAHSLIQSLAYSNGGHFLVTGGRDGTISIWDQAIGGQLVKTIKEEYSIGSLSFSPDGKYLAMTSYDSHLMKIYSTLTWKLEFIFSSKEDENPVKVLFSPALF